MLPGNTVLRFGAIVLVCIVATSLSLTSPEPAYAAADPLLGEVILFAGNFAPRGWLTCEGQLLAISSNTALFSILGTTYGGDGRTTFALPDLRGRVPVGDGQGPGLSRRTLGTRYGAETHTLSTAQMPAHSHAVTTTATATLMADGAERRNAKEKEPTGRALGWGRKKIYSDGEAVTPMDASSIDLSVGVSVGSTGGSQAFSLSQPSIVMKFIIAVQGLYPSRN